MIPARAPKVPGITETQRMSSCTSHGIRCVEERYRCSLLSYIFLGLLVFASLRMTAAQTVSRDVGQPAANLKTVELAGKYRMQVPAYFTMQVLPAGPVRAAPAVAFTSNTNNIKTWFQVEVQPYVGAFADDRSTGKLKLPAPLTHYFTISGNRDVYYGWTVVDNAYECTMNSPCPAQVPARSRYTAWYTFKVFDKPNNSIVEFTGAHSGPSKEVAGFEGVGKILRHVIVPSLTAIRQPATQ